MSNFVPSSVTQLVRAVPAYRQTLPKSGPVTVLASNNLGLGAVTSLVREVTNAVEAGTPIMDAYASARKGMFLSESKMTALKRFEAVAGRI